MKWGALLGISIIVICIILLQMPKLYGKQKKEMIAFISLSFLGWILAVMLIFYPEMLGPTQWIDEIFKPLGRLLEK